MQSNQSTNSLPPISFSEACSIVDAQCQVILAAALHQMQTCELSAALGRILATPVVADRDQPPFPRVTRDGFAVRAEDLSENTALRVVGQLRAGQAWPAERPALVAGEVIEIMTGAPLPPGADAVLMVEHAQEIRDANEKSILRPLLGRRLAAGENVVPTGSEARRGEIVIEAGTRLKPEEIALAASCGLVSVSVYAAPLVAILATGDELLTQASLDAQGSRIQPHQIYDSNSHSLAALVQQAGSVPLRQRAARDRREDLAASIRQGFHAAPLLLLTGGVSMGKYDLVEEVLAGMGAEFFFTGVKMQPGKPVVFGRAPAGVNHPARYFFGLPGNPVSTMVTFRAFVRPLLAALAGERHWQPQIALAQLATDVQCKPGLTRFLPSRLDSTGSAPTVTPVKTQGSGDLAANARANCYVIVPDDCEILPAQQPVRILLQ